MWRHAWLWCDYYNYYGFSFHFLEHTHSKTKTIIIITPTIKHAFGKREKTEAEERRKSYYAVLQLHRVNNIAHPRAEPLKAHFQTTPRSEIWIKALSIEFSPDLHFCIVSMSACNHPTTFFPGVLLSLNPLTCETAYRYSAAIDIPLLGPQSVVSRGNRQFFIHASLSWRPAKFIRRAVLATVNIFEALWGSVDWDPYRNTG